MPQEFFQVSINMEKFNLFANSIASTLTAHQKLIQSHTKQLAQLRLNADDKLSRMKGQLDYEIQRFDKKRKEDNCFFNSFLNDTTKKHDLAINQSKTRLLTLQNKLENLKSQEEIASSVSQEIKQVIDEQVKLLEEEISSIESHTKKIEQQLQKSINTQNFLLKNVMDAYDSKPKDAVSQMPNESRQMKPRKINPSKNNNPPQKQKPPQHQRAESPGSEQRANSLQQATLRQAQERRRRKVQQKCERQNLQYASISAKIDSLENRLIAKENQNLNIVKYPQKERVSSEASQKGLPCSIDFIQIERRNFEQNITEKLQHIQEVIKEKMTVGDKELQKIKHKLEALADQLDIASRKSDKDRNRIVDFAMQLKRYEEKRVDDRFVDSLVVMIKKQARTFQEQLQKKMQKEIWEKEFLRLTAKLQIFSEGLNQKANKDQIRRAFQFVEDKIKEIVLLMADDAQHQKEGAGRRLPFKCLSCDKDLQISAQNTQRNNASSRAPGRCSSSNLRKRIRGGGPLESR